MILRSAIRRLARFCAPYRAHAPRPSSRGDYGGTPEDLGKATNEPKDVVTDGGAPGESSDGGEERETLVLEEPPLPLLELQTIGWSDGSVVVMPVDESRSGREWICLEDPSVIISAEDDAEIDRQLVRLGLGRWSA